MEENRNIDEEAAPKEKGLWRVVKVDVEDGEEQKDNKLYNSREEAEVVREKLQKELVDNMWDLRGYFNMVEHQLRFVTFGALAEEKRQKLEYNGKREI